MESKELYKFVVYEDKEVLVEDKNINEKTGEETIVKKKTIEKSPIEIILKKPTRRQTEEADLQYSIEMSQCIKKGILTRAMLSKKYSDSGGLMSEQESEKLVDLYREIYEQQNSLIRLEALSESEKTEEIKEKISLLFSEITNLKKQIVELESAYRSLFDHTADSKAQNKVLLWYVLNLTYIKRPSDLSEKNYFQGKEFEEKLESFYALEEAADELHVKISKQIMTFVAFWFFNQASSSKDFEELGKKIESGEL